MQIKLDSEFKFSVLFVCIIFDAIDYGVDFLTTLFSSIGIGSGLVSTIGDSINFLFIPIGCIAFYLLNKDDSLSPIVFAPAILDPMFEDIYPSYTATYVATVFKGWLNGRK